MPNIGTSLPWPVHDLLVKYLEGGPENVTAPGNADGRYLIPSRLRLAENVGIETTEIISMFVPPPESSDRNTDPPVLRQLKRRLKPAVMARFKEQGSLEWPLVEATYFEITRLQLETLDSLVRGIEAAAERSPIAADGASVWFWYGPDHRVLEVPPPNQPPSRRYTVELISQPVERLHFYASDPSLTDLKLAWEAAWHHLHVCCTPEQRVEPVETWKIEPRLYARLLSAGVHNR